MLAISLAIATFVNGMTAGLGQPPITLSGTEVSALGAVFVQDAIPNDVSVLSNISVDEWDLGGSVVVDVREAAATERFRFEASTLREAPRAEVGHAAVIRLSGVDAEAVRAAYLAWSSSVAKAPTYFNALVSRRFSATLEQAMSGEFTVAFAAPGATGLCSTYAVRMPSWTAASHC